MIRFDPIFAATTAARKSTDRDVKLRDPQAAWRSLLTCLMRHDI